MTSVFIAAPTPVARAGLRAMLEGEELHVLGEGASLTEGGDLPPDVDVVVIADEALLSEAAQANLGGDGEVAVVLLSGSERAAALLRSLPVRGWAIVAPDAPAAELAAAVMSASQGLVALSLSMAARLLNPQGAQTLQDGPLQEPLTPRELEVLSLLSQGLPNKQIARRLLISEHTVKFHISSIYTKLGASSRTEAVNRGARRGLITF